MEETFTIAPLACASICGSTALQVRNIDVRFVPITRCQSASLSSTGPPIAPIPTLLWRMSMRP
jgi:hypothetical protein